MKNRLEMLREMAAQDPGNAFVSYGLAQELANQGMLEEARMQFLRLVDTNPDYPPAYFHGGKTLERLGRTDEARALYQRGVGACERAGDEHARSEMLGALEALG